MQIIKMANIAILNLVAKTFPIECWVQMLTFVGLETSQSWFWRPEAMKRYTCIHRTKSIEPSGDEACENMTKNASCELRAGWGKKWVRTQVAKRRQFEARGGATCQPISINFIKFLQILPCKRRLPNVMALWNCQWFFPHIESLYALPFTRYRVGLWSYAYSGTQWGSLNNIIIINMTAWLTCLTARRAIEQATHCATPSNWYYSKYSPVWRHSVVESSSFGCSAVRHESFAVHIGTPFVFLIGRIFIYAP